MYVGPNGVWLQLPDAVIAYDPYRYVWHSNGEHWFRVGDYTVSDGGFESETLADIVRFLLARLFQ